MQNAALAPTAYDDLSIIIPTLNEAGTIERLLLQLQVLYPGATIIVADEASADGTADIVEAFFKKSSAFPLELKLLRRLNAAERGLTASVLEGLEAVETEYFVVTDADLQHPPEIISSLYEKLSAGAELVIAERRPYVERQPFHRVLMTSCATIVAYSYLYLRGIRIGDPMAGFFGGNTSYIRPIVKQARSRFEPRGYKILFDLLRVAPTDIRLENVTFDFQLRDAGYSKLRPRHAFYFFRSLFR